MRTLKNLKAKYENFWHAKSLSFQEAYQDFKKVKWGLRESLLAQSGRNPVIKVKMHELSKLLFAMIHHYLCFILEEAINAEVNK